MFMIVPMVVPLSRDTARRLTRARKLGGLSSRQLSELAGLANGFAAQIERGAAKAPAFGVIDSLAQVLGLSLDWLAHGTGPEPTRDSIALAIEVARNREVAA